MPFIGVQPASALLTSADIQDGQITTAKIANDAVDNTKLDLTSSYDFSAGLTLGDNLTFDVAGKGVHLGVTSATASNLIDDFEVGLFTPTLSPQSGSIGLSHAEGVYSKIGNVVHVQINFYTNAVSSPSGALVVGGLPFTSIANNVHGGSSSYNGRTAGSLYMDLQASGASGEFMILAFANATTANIYLGEDNTNSDSANKVDASTYIVVGLSYQAQ